MAKIKYIELETGVKQKDYSRSKTFTQSNEEAVSSKSVVAI